MRNRFDFSEVRWQQVSPHERFKGFIAEGMFLRLVELRQPDGEVDWCIRRHVGYITEGRLEVVFAERSPSQNRVVYEPGDGLYIPAGEAHRPNPLTPRVYLVTFEAPLLGEPSAHPAN